MATPIEDITFLARTARGLKGVSGGDITLPSSTTAEGLDKAGSITIDAHAGTDTNVDVVNTGAGDVTLRVFGDLSATATVTDDLTVSNGITFKNDPGVSKGVIDGTFSATRTFNFPNFDGNVVVTSTTNVNTGRIMVSGNVHLQDNGSTQAIQLTGSPSGNRTVTFQDITGTVALLEANPQTFTGLQSFNASANFRNGNVQFYNGFSQFTMRLDLDNQRLGFYDTAPVSRPVLATGAGATVDDVITALQTLGLVSQT